MLDNIENGLNNSLKKIAEVSLLKKLEQKNINKNDLSTQDFEELLKMEIEIIKNDGKKVGAGVAAGIAISLLSGGLF